MNKLIWGNLMDDGRDSWLELKWLPQLTANQINILADLAVACKPMIVT
jgi:hypothetical protein